ncbi:flagellar biosynthetic protein FliO [Desulfoplanes formicivorans]|uniref:Flagellar protein n=1 Tax=Desulfoplanes formicivorans TaxID=1592317 RepID=A0A194AGP3_9BACT|nr:flagellar biosynthetic protein FliO [Desulfoplanes formicivorans]GAU08380.1 flagellar assembly protein FliO [Desulfoplanes formicivorans]
MPNATSFSGSSSYMGDFLHMLGWLCVILALVFVVLYLLKRFGPQAGLSMGGGKSVKILGQVSLGPKKHLVVVRFLNKILVLGVTDTQINLVTEMTTDESTSFEDVLDATTRGNKTSRPG